MYTLATTVFEVLWKALGLPAMPACIAVDQHGATMAERAAVRARHHRRLPHHTRRRLTGSVGYLDTPRGRYLVRQRDDRSGECHTAVLPASAGALRMLARELLRM